MTQLQTRLPFSVDVCSYQLRAICPAAPATICIWEVQGDGWLWKLSWSKRHIESQKLHSDELQAIEEVSGYAHLMGFAFGSGWELLIDRAAELRAQGQEEQRRREGELAPGLAMWAQEQTDSDEQEDELVMAVDGTGAVLLLPKGWDNHG